LSKKEHNDYKNHVLALSNLIEERYGHLSHLDDLILASNPCNHETIYNLSKLRECMNDFRDIGMRMWHWDMDLCFGSE
ncbi:MAG: hypothetical protein Q9174_004844, partial [Haloplaca sp. 1 TL-2023]